MESWWLQNRKRMIGQSQGQREGDAAGSKYELRAKPTPPNYTLRKLKDARQSVECKKLSKREMG